METTACSILLVDDEDANLDLLEIVLRRRGYGSLTRVNDARHALSAFESTRPDLVLLDLHMPHRSGFEILEELRQRTPAGEFLPVLVLTADVTSQARERALAGGAQDFLTKPFDRVEVLLRVRNLLQTRLLYREQSLARQAAERAAERDRLLAEASRRLAASFDSSTALTQLAALLTERWADACTFDLDGASTTPESLSDGGTPGAALLAPAEDGAVLDGEPRRHGVRVPIAGSAASAGWLNLARSEDRDPFKAEDLALAAELGRRAGLAVENARAFHAAREALAARDQVLAIVAHDLRGPLTAVRFEVEMLRLDPFGPLAPEDASTLGRVEQAVGRMDGLIQDLLDVARATRGVLELDRRPNDMGALLAEAAATARPLVEAQGLAFDVHGPADLPLLDVDGARVLQAISNLVGNAAKFTRHGGRVSLAWQPTGDGLRISVADEGPGIAPEQLQHIFGAFWQARHADRRGLGLGLAIVRAIAEAHGGRIWVESEVGRGSTFVLALPRS